MEKKRSFVNNKFNAFCMQFSRILFLSVDSLKLINARVLDRQKNKMNIYCITLKNMITNVHRDIYMLFERFE